MAACGLKQGVNASSALVTAWAVSGNPAKAAEVLKELEDQSKDLDQYAYTSVISAFADEANASASQEWFNYMAQRGFDADVAASNAVLKAIVRKNLSAAESWLQAMPQQKLAPTAVSYNTLLGGLAQAGREEEIRLWMERMRAARCMPGIVTYNAIIRGFTKLGMLPQAEGWLRQLQGARLNPDTRTYNQLIRGCAPDIPSASGWFEEMQLQTLEPDAVSYNSIIHCCGQAVQPKLAHRWLRAMERSGLEPGVIAWSSLLAACAKGEDKELGEASLREMLDRRLQLNSYTLKAVRRLFGHSRGDMLLRELSAKVTTEVSAARRKRRLAKSRQPSVEDV